MNLINQVAAQALLHAPEHMKNSVKAVKQPTNIIVAETYPIARAALAALLSSDGFRVFQAENAISALAAIDSVDKVAVLLADLDMPEWRFVVRRAVEKTDAVVIAMEGNHPYSAMYDLTRRGISMCVQKPILYKDLLVAIKQKLSAQRGKIRALDYKRPQEAGSGRATA